MFDAIVPDFEMELRSQAVDDGAPDRAESARIASLRSYDILDTEAEDAYDRIVELARVVFDAPMALLSFIDSERQWTKASAGIDARGDLPRGIAFCDHTIRQSDVMIIPDAREDARFANNPLVTGAPHVRFYAGAPMVTPEGARIGAVCIVSTEPRAGLADADSRRLKALAGIATNELELRRKTAQARLLTKEVEHRVKTTLHCVSRLLEAQAARSQDRQVRKHLLEAVDRIAGVEVVQRHLHHGGSVFSTDAHDYLLSLVASLEETLLDPTDGRTISVVESGNLVISPDSLAILGMVVVELVTNALKHGRGNVVVQATPTRDAMSVSVTDEGRGFSGNPADLLLNSRVGLRLVSMLALPDGIDVNPLSPQRITVRLAC